MNPLFDDTRDLHTLFEGLFEGTLSPTHLQKLDALLVSDPVVRRRYVEYAQLQTSLAASVSEVSAGPTDRPAALRLAPILQPPSSEVPQSLPDDKPGLSFFWGGFSQGALLPLFTVAVFAVGALLGIYFRTNPAGANSTPLVASAPVAEPRSSDAFLASGSVVVNRSETTGDNEGFAATAPFATLVKVAGCRWGACTLPTQTGSRLTAGLLRLESGKAQISFDNGSRLFLQGPAVFYLYSPSRAYLQSGKLVANIPEQAIGFTIETQQAEIVDLGTEFGVSAESGGDTEVQVLDGEVEVGIAPAPADPQHSLQDTAAAPSETPESQRRRLEVGEARRIGTARHDWRRVDFTPEQFKLLRPSSRATPESPWRRLLSDDFDDNYLDPAKWQVRTDGVPSGHPQVRESDGRITLVDRGRLVTSNELDPVRLEGLRITGQWTFQTPQDMFEIVLRTDGIAGGSEGAVINGVHFAARMERTTSHIGIFGTGNMLDVSAAYGDILINPGDVFNFEILDVPGGMSLRLREASGSGAEAHVHTLAPHASQTNYVAFYNGARRKSAQVAFLDNVVCEQGNGSVRMSADGVIDIKP